MYVDYKGIPSKEHNINYGGPQWSALGPLPFILYANDLPNTLTVSKSILFADDTTIYYSNSNLCVCTNLNKDLQIITTGLKQINCHLMSVENNAELKNNHWTGKYVNQAKYTKFVGIYIDENLDWSKHIQQCKCKIASGNYAINVTKNVSSTLKIIVLQFSLPNYGILLWGNTYNKYLHKLEISPKKPIRIINRAMYNSYE